MHAEDTTQFSCPPFTTEEIFKLCFLASAYNMTEFLRPLKALLSNAFVCVSLQDKVEFIIKILSLDHEKTEKLVSGKKQPNSEQVSNIPSLKSTK
jgi:hypothetical protein